MDGQMRKLSNAARVAALIVTSAELDGYDATREIRAKPEYRHQAVKIVALTAAAVQGDRQRCLAAGME